MPDFQRFPYIIHSHFLAFTLWFVLLIVQPLLIKRKKVSLHRKLGKLTYVLVPILVITIIILNKNQIEREVVLPTNQAPITAFIAVIDTFSFSLYYLLAMIFSKNMRWHIAFLLAATLVVLNSGLSRLLNQIQYGLGMIVVVLLPFVLSIFVIFFEKIKYKKSILKSPYFLYLCIWTMTILLFVTIPQSEFWSQMIFRLFIK